MSMSTSNPWPAGVVLQRITDPSDDELAAIIQAMSKGFATESLETHFPIPSKADPSEYRRIQYMAYLGPGLIKGNVWIARMDDEVVGVAIWATPGCTLSDTPEQKRYKAAMTEQLSLEHREWQTQVQSRVIEERDALFPGLGRSRFHLHMLVTVPEARGKGIGGALIGEMAKQASAQGQGMSLCTHSEPNRKFYERQGFRTFWERQLTYPNGTKEPYIVMTQDVESDGM